ncbi:MAG: hypothetical protein KDH20_18915 [Rhodocyclaceae bacterium]|nr:hypothetical protein [Rhodocyclaceae bacterium]
MQRGRGSQERRTLRVAFECVRYRVARLVSSAFGHHAGRHGLRKYALTRLAAVLGLTLTAPAFGADWLVLSGLSHHFQDRRDWREVNPGAGFERDIDEGPYGPWTFSAGYLKNSYDKHSVYLGGRWTPLALGPVRFGAFGLLASGYPSPVLVLPTMVIENRHVGANLLAVPNLPGYSGYIGIQVRFAIR